MLGPGRAKVTKMQLKSGQLASIFRFLQKCVFEQHSNGFPWFFRFQIVARRQKINKKTCLKKNLKKLTPEIGFFQKKLKNWPQWGANGLLKRDQSQRWICPGLILQGSWGQDGSKSPPRALQDPSEDDFRWIFGVFFSSEDDFLIDSGRIFYNFWFPCKKYFAKINACCCMAASCDRALPQRLRTEWHLQWQAWNWRLTCLLCACYRRLHANYTLLHLTFCFWLFPFDFWLHAFDSLHLTLCISLFCIWHFAKDNLLYGTMLKTICYTARWRGLPKAAGYIYIYIYIYIYQGVSGTARTREHG